jgi:hypothetical protein
MGAMYWGWDPPCLLQHGSHRKGCYTLPPALEPAPPLTAPMCTTPRRAFRDGFTITLVSGRTVGIGAYLARLGRRCVQRSDQPIILTGGPVVVAVVVVVMVVVVMVVVVVVAVMVVVLVVVVVVVVVAVVAVVVVAVVAVVAWRRAPCFGCLALGLEAVPGLLRR